MAHLLKSLLAIILALCLNFSARGQDAPPNALVEWEKRQNAEQRMTALGDDLMGDQIDPHTGSISFEHTDVSLPGNSALPVALTRRLSQGFLYADSVNAEFGDWEFVTPRIKVTTATARPFNGNRCTTSFATQFNTLQYSGGQIMGGFEYTNGVKLDVPGYGVQEILEKRNLNMWPAAATHVTTGNWYLKCGPASDGGQGFIGYAPNGDVYNFDRVIVHDQARLGYGIRDLIDRKTYILAATKVTDVHNNTVSYVYDSLGRLDKIQGSDGRLIDLQYSGNSKLVTRATAHGRTWRYDYRRTNYFLPPWAPSGYKDVIGLSRNVLQKVTLPDGRFWSLNLDGMTGRPGPGESCSHPQFNLSLQHPSGATGTFRMREIKHRNYTLPLVYKPQACPLLEPTPGTGPFGFAASTAEQDDQLDAEPATELSLETSAIAATNVGFRQYATIDALSVIEKELSGAGLPTATWTYTYESDDSLVTTVEPTNWTKVQGPASHVTFIHYWSTVDNGGKLKRQEIRGSEGGGVLQSVDYQYKTEGFVGNSFFGVGANPGDVKRPVRTTKVTTKQGSQSFARIMAYDMRQDHNKYTYGLPKKVTLTSPTASSRIEKTAYYHNKTKWILGLPVTVIQNGKQFYKYHYNAEGKLGNYKKFGVLKGVFGYHGDGTLAWSRDALSRQINLDSYKAGLAQTLTRPDGVPLRRSVDNFGQITSVTDARGNQTSFTYNQSGWLTRINRPGSYWADTILSYANLSGGVVQTITQGGKRETVTYDRMQRPIKTQAQDLTGHSAAIHTKMTYDAAGRAIFTSFPSHGANPSAGTDTTYDALGRVTRTTETVSPFASTRTQYLSRNRVRVTDPVNGRTTTTYRAFGAPATDEAMSVVDATGTTTTFTRDIYGNITRLNQASGLNGYTESVSREFWYDNQLRLCRHRAPELGDELFIYNNADELTRSSRGEAAATGCAQPTTALRTIFTYDNLGRQKRINYPRGTPDIFKTYDLDGNLATTRRGGANWTYNWNELNLLTQEALQIDGRTYTLKHGYDANGNAKERFLPDNSRIEFDPDGFGQPTTARVFGWRYVDNVQYHPNGLPSSATLKSGKTMTQTLNARLLPASLRIAGAGGVTNDLSYSYNKRGQVTRINEAALSGLNRTFGYDKKGRLTSANGPWGTGRFVYDGLENLRRKTLGSQVTEITYAGNQVSTVNRTGEALRTFSHDARGNTTSNGLASLTYDHANQPTRIVSGGVTQTHKYDGNLKRVKTVENGVTTYWIYSMLTGGVVHKDSSNASRPTDYFSAGGTLVRREGNAFSFSHLDHQGTPISQTNGTTGARLWREEYTPFGEKRLNPSQGRNHVGYTGHIQDEATGLTYMQARYYDPTIGRFLSTDPIGYQDQLNLYSYVHNDPMNATDPTGLDSVHRKRFAQNAKSRSGSGIGIGQAAGFVADFVPVVGDIKGAIEFAQNPSLIGAAAVVVGLVPGVGDLAGKGLKQLDNAGDVARNTEFGDARFVTDPNGNTVDLESTARGSYDQPNGGRTDILQRENHGAGTSHTHQPMVNTNPQTGQTFINGLDNGQPVTAAEVDNIREGVATRSESKGR